MERERTPNQEVAWNMAFFRKASGLTQEQLGERLGWGKGIVSTAERSWDAKRIRQFTADDITVIAKALEIPVTALLLPVPPSGRPENALVEFLEEQLEAARKIPVHTSCLTCHGEPPEGFTCNTCGTEASA